MDATEQDPVARAKAEMADFDRKINMMVADEARIASQRKRMEAQRDKIRSFLEMYEHYVSVPETEVRAEEEVAPEHKRVRLIRRIVKPAKVERKPKGIPTMPDMIKAAISAAVEQGKPGLEPKDITAFIRQKWWPTVKGESVSPITWRMANQGQLKREGSMYLLVAA